VWIPNGMCSLAYTAGTAIIHPMEDSEAVKILTRILQDYPLKAEEQEAIRGAIGLMSWTKLVEGFNDRRKAARDRRLEDEGSEPL
jgi:hypothetical protein